MTRETAILIALIAFLGGLLVVGILAKRRTNDSDGFYLGGRTLGPWVAALAANASSSSAWSISPSATTRTRYAPVPTDWRVNAEYRPYWNKICFPKIGRI